MDVFPSQSAQQESATEDQVVYVDELAGPEDYWLSITDASRVCRVQDVSIRRAIARKALPVRRQRAGQNKRTRFVRASDLALAGFPIIDESATITTQIGKVDLLSIPRQQQQIVQEHQALLLNLEEMRETLSTYQRQVTTDLSEQQERFQISLQASREEHLRQLAEIEKHLAQEQQRLQLALTEASFRLTHDQQGLQRDITQEKETARQHEERLSTELDALRQELAQERTEALARTEQEQAAFLAYRQEIQQHLSVLAITQQETFERYVNNELQRVEQHMQEGWQSVEQRMAESVKQVAQTMEVRLASLTQTLVQVQQDVENVRHQAEVRAQELERTLGQQQVRITQAEQLLPLLPYTQQRLATAQDMTRLELGQTALEARLLSAQQRELERYQPLLALLSPEHLETLAHVLEQAQGKKML